MSRVALISALVLTALWTGFSMAQDDAKQLDIHGRWKLIDIKSSGPEVDGGFAKFTLVASDRRLTWEYENGSRIESEFKTGNAAGLKTLDFAWGTDGDGGKPITRLGIYAIKDDKLSICFSAVVPVEESRRPADFSTNPGLGRMLLLLDRVRD
jgi:uncharacterized protein (TIGR03067 family)